MIVLLEYIDLLVIQGCRKVVRLQPDWPEWFFGPGVCVRGLGNGGVRASLHVCICL